jgi:hypothetical protein
MGPISEAFSSATKAVRFDRIVITGLLIILAMIVVLSFVMPLLAPDSKGVDFVLGFFKDMALIMVGALANSVRQKHGDDVQEG